MWQQQVRSRVAGGDAVEALATVLVTLDVDVAGSERGRVQLVAVRVSSGCGGQGW